MKNQFLLLLIAIFLIAACAEKERIETDKHDEFIGTWTGQSSTRDYSIVFSGSGTGSYESFESEANFVSISGRSFLVPSKDKLKIAGKGFKIDLYPYETDSVWYMVVDGIQYEKDE